MNLASLDTSIVEMLVTFAFYVILFMAYAASRWSYAVSQKLPQWLDSDWRHQAESFLEKPDASPEPSYSWWTPTRGPKEESKKNALRWIPLVGPLLSKEYALFINELWMFGLTICLLMFCDPIDTATGVIFFGMLRCASMVDHKTQLLPDCLTIPLMWFGLAKSLVYGDTQNMLAGAIVGFMMLWMLQKAYLIFRKVDGMGGGDLKIAAAIGAWVGVTMVPAALFIGAFVGIFYAIVAAIRAKGFGRFAFGPSLAIGGMLTYYAGHLLPVYTMAAGG